MLFLQLQGVEGAEPPSSTAGPKARGATLRETEGFPYYMTAHAIGTTHDLDFTHGLLVNPSEIVNQHPFLS